MDSVLVEKCDNAEGKFKGKVNKEERVSTIIESLPVDKYSTYIFREECG